MQRLSLHSRLLLSFHFKTSSGSKKKIDKKLAVDGYFDDWIEPYVDDYYSDDWHYNDWAWEYEDYDDSSTSNGLVRTGVGMEPTLSPAPTITPSPTGTGYSEEEMAALGRTGVQSRFDGGSSVIAEDSSSAQSAQANTNPYALTFSFPTIQHMIYSGSIHLKAHSIHDLTELDPEIFAVLQSQLTPYLQAIVGHTLQAYSLEVDYTPGYAEDQKSVAPGIVVTNLEVTCTLKVRSDSIGSLTRITHNQAHQWIRDFFGGSEITVLLTELQNNNIHVNEIVFVEDTFKTNDGQVIAGINSGGGTGGSSPSSNSGSNTGMVIGVTMAIIAVGGVLFLHLTGNLPSREDLRDIRHSLREKLHLDSGSEGYHGGSSSGSNDDEDGSEPKGRRRTWSATFKRHPDTGIRKAAIQKKPAYSDDYLSLGTKSVGSKRSSSSDGKTSSTPSSSPKSTRTPNSASNENHSESGTGFDDYSFSVAGDYNVDGDYDMAIRSQGSPSRRSSRPSYSRGNSPRTNTSHSRGDIDGNDEFSMPEDYDTILHGDDESLYSKWSQSVMTFLPGRKNHKKRDKANVISPPPGSPRRVTPADLGSHSDRRVPRSRQDGGNAAFPAGMDAWSVDSFDTKSPSASGMYREWSSSNPNGMKSPTSRSTSKRSKLAIPSFD
jgi:hypothetical protein